MAKILDLFGGSAARKFRPTRITGEVTALDLDWPVIRVVRGERKGEAAAISLIETSQSDLSEDSRSSAAKVGAAVSGMLGKAEIKPGIVLMGIPRTQVVLRTLSLPALEDGAALAAMVHFQIGRDLPFRLEDAVVDFSVGRPVVPSAPAEPVEGKASTSKVEVMVAVVKREIVEFYQQTAESAGIKLGGLGLLSHANARCLEACGLTASDEAVALVSLREEQVTVDIIIHQTLLFSRNAILKQHHEDDEEGPPIIPHDAVQSDAPKPTFANLATIEVERTLNSYGGTEGAKRISKVVVTGASGPEAPILLALSERLHIPCSRLEVRSTLNLPETDDGRAEGCIGLIGLILGASDPAGLAFDFLNPKKPAIQRDNRKLRNIAIAATVAVLLVITMVTRAHLLRKRSAVEQDLLTQLASAEKGRPTFKRMGQQAKVIDEWAKGGKDWLVHYAYLSSILPPSDEVYISSLLVGANDSVRLALQAKSGEILAKLEKQLRGAGYEVKPIAITPGSDRFGYGFRSTVELLVPAKFKIDPTKMKAPERPADDASLDPSVYKRGGG
ncbi:MAG: hypothetical protein JWM99_2139 [Verrucomicrobiales bacterium]|nr:hypothetical protein [Verrucomicrobiales bacterium]